MIFERIRYAAPDESPLHPGQVFDAGGNSRIFQDSRLRVFDEVTLSTLHKLWAGGRSESTTGCVLRAPGTAKEQNHCDCLVREGWRWHTSICRRADFAG